MLDPKFARELSWAAAKLREVAAVLSRHSVALTNASGRESMSAVRAVGQGMKATSPGELASEDWTRQQIPLEFYDDHQEN